ncbi:MAG: rod shape-determining protein MreC, partial [Oscillochloris sp.]|nr:rod shape-determining protein MreC [Oscillochloris sp.]
EPLEVTRREVAVRSPDAGRRVITIARGSDDEVQVGMAVIGQTPGGPAALIGIVESVTQRSAAILLITDISSQISARTLHEQRASLGLLSGQWQRGSRLQLSQIDRSAPVTIGDPVVTAGLTGNLGLPLDLAAVPADIPIGSIDSITTSGQNQVAEIRPFADPDQVRYVWVILSHDD